jgi:hypothetical protein
MSRAAPLVPSSSPDGTDERRLMIAPDGEVTDALTLDVR